MEDENFDGIMQGLGEAAAYMKGQREGFQVHTVTNIKALRERLGMSQATFSETFGLRLQTLQQWESGRRVPRGPEASYLRVIDREPEAVRRALTQ